MAKIEKDVKFNRAARYQLLAKSWSDKYSYALNHSQKLMNLWISGYYQPYARWHMINLMNRGVSTVVSYLVEGDPRIMIEPLAPKLRPFAYNLRLIINYLLERERFAETVLIPGATASMFGGVAARTFYEYDRCVSIDNQRIKVGTPRVAIIEGSDYIGDPSAKRRSDFAFEGDVYRLPTAYAKDLFSGKDKFGNQIADYIEADCNLVTKYSSQELTQNKSYDWNRLALEEYTSFIDIFNFKDKTIETIMPMGHKAKVLRTIEWTGPGSPYSYLGYKYPPNCPVPIPPAWDWYDLDMTMNILAKAAREQAESQKNVVVAEPGSKEAAQSLLNAKNQDVVVVKGADGVRTHSLGGVSADNYNWLSFAENEFTKSGTASSDVMGGRGSSAPTLGQEQIVVANASRIVNNFYNRFHTWTEDIIRKWTAAVIANPTTYVEVLNTVKLPGIGDYEYPVYLSKPDITADFYDFVLKVIPYSTQRSTPEMKYQRLFQFMTSWILPTMQIRQQQGTDIDLPMVDKILADYGGFDQFPAWYKNIVPHEGIDIDYLVKSNAGQGNDKVGATETSRAANSLGYQQRNGVGMDSGNLGTKQ